MSAPKILFVFVVFVLNFAITPLILAGTVTGKVNFTGTPPAPESINTDADPVCAGLHPQPLMSEEVAANPDGTLQHVFVYVREGLEGKTFEPPSQPVTMDQKGCQYVPHVFGIQVGQTLQILNSDATLHNVHGMPTQSREFNLGMPIQGMKLTRKFDKPEVAVKFKCDVHPWMSAYAGVLNHPFFSVTGQNGSYEIQNLPAGTYALEAWHEKYGTQTARVTVDEVAAATADFTFAGNP